MKNGGGSAIEEASRFFRGTDSVHRALHSITSCLDELKIPYAVAGGMALVAHGYDRTTTDVDILLTADGLAQTHRELEGLGYVTPFKDSKNLRDTATGVRIEFLVAGQFPGDGKPKPVAFPDPASVGVEKDGIRYLGLPTLIELKLASGMTAPHRLKDLADVQELIKALTLQRDFGQQLDPYVQAKFAELWDSIEAAGPQD
ncbi:MAG TPA: hypothetical protein VFC78_15510 [Tepidisphaeraceae bacterium]|nr:hypothetical protein [Tepidisphaeraceae bacterium]